MQEEFEYYKVESQDAFKDSQATIIEYSRKIKELEDHLGAQKKLLVDQQELETEVDELTASKQVMKNELEKA